MFPLGCSPYPHPVSSPSAKATTWSTYADHAREGIWHDVRCLHCRRQTLVACRTMVERGFGGLDVIETKHRLKCDACEKRGVSISLHGYWIGPAELQPPDWADTVEARMPKEV